MRQKILRQDRLLIGGTNSGCGKTTITCALLSLLRKKGASVSSFKCGPDYIDPMFHEKAIGVQSANLDAFFCDDNTLLSLLAENSAGTSLSVIEGVMGYYDGMSLSSEKASAYDLARITGTPAILCVNCKGMANSAVALVKGFAEYRSDSMVKGIILNNISKATYQAVKGEIEKNFPNILVCGYIPKLPEDLILESRHLGLITAGEVEGLIKKLDHLADIAAETLDLEKIQTVSRLAEEKPYQEAELPRLTASVRIAVAYDKAFCFYYKDNLNLLRKMGAELIFFSPLSDKALPAGTDGVYLGGGYPELYAKTLSQNREMCASLKEALEKGTPCIAECGGFLYLSDTLEGEKMVGFLPGQGTNQGKLVRFGYVSLTAGEDNLLCQKGGTIKGHEFHYFDSTENGNGFTAKKPSGKSWECAFAGPDLYAGFPHLHFYSNPDAAYRFLRRCLEQKQHRKDDRI